MPAPQDVKPQRWSELSVIFDRDGYSVAVGNFTNDNGDCTPALGMRWNGAGDSLGFPNQAGNPILYVVPEFLVGPILHTILDESLFPPLPDRNTRVHDTLRSLIARRAG